MGKNVLNKFRQDNGYKQGLYKKEWNGIEDNVIMNEILNSGLHSPNEIYKTLQQRYEKAK